MPIKSLSFDAKKKALKGKFEPSKNAERDFYRALKRVAHTSGHIVDQHVDGVKIVDPKKMQDELKRYSEKLGPWAEKQSAKLLAAVQKSNKKAYKEKSEAISVGIRLNIEESDIGIVAISLMTEQVGLIKSIPLEAGLRAQEIAYEAVLQGTRAEVNQDTIDELQKQLGLTTEVATSRAKLIAITETARANASINQARAMSVGSSQYRWHNSGDGAVRESHKFYHGKKMQGQIFSWDNPPTLDDGMKGHPGTFPRCRCFAEPIFDNE